MPLPSDPYPPTSQSPPRLDPTQYNPTEPAEATDVVDDLARDDEALIEWLAGPEFAPVPPFLPNQRDLHFRIALLNPDAELQRDLLEQLQRMECAVTTMEATTIAGYLQYNPRYRPDREATASPTARPTAASGQRGYTCVRQRQGLARWRMPPTEGAMQRGDHVHKRASMRGRVVPAVLYSANVALWVVTAIAAGSFDLLWLVIFPLPALGLYLLRTRGR